MKKYYEKRNSPTTPSKRGNTFTSLAREQFCSRSLEKTRKTHDSFYGNEGIRGELQKIQNAVALKKNNVFKEHKKLINHSKETLDYFFQKGGQAEAENKIKTKFLLVRQKNKISEKQVIVAHMLRKGFTLDIKDGYNVLPYRLSPINKRMRKELESVFSDPNLVPSNVYENVVIGEADTLFDVLFEEWKINQDVITRKDFNLQNRHIKGEVIYKGRRLQLWKEFKEVAKRYVKELQETKITNPQHSLRDILFYDAPKRFYFDTTFTVKINGCNLDITPYKLLTGEYDENILEACTKVRSKKKDKIIDEVRESLLLPENSKKTLEQVVNEKNYEIINSSSINNVMILAPDDIKDKEARDSFKERFSVMEKDFIEKIQSLFCERNLHYIIVANKANDKVFLNSIKGNISPHHTIEHLFNYDQKAIDAFTENGLLEFCIEVRKVKYLMPYMMPKNFYKRVGDCNITRDKYLTFLFDNLDKEMPFYYFRTGGDCTSDTLAKAELTSQYKKQKVSGLSFLRATLAR